MSSPRSLLIAPLLMVPLLCAVAFTRQCAGQVQDSDRDGLSDQLEQRLLEQFSPEFHISEKDCAGAPAEFRPGVDVPALESADGTIYGQVFPIRSPDPLHPEVEAHFYHLWSRDCGGHGHRLDTEHVAVLLRGSGDDLATATWRAEYWYAAAHENTVCDVSQIARASTLHAETKGAKVWVSEGKHASYLDERLCRGGCGADRCEGMKRLQTARIINLGEPQRAMNGSVFASSSQWPLEGKMRESNFAAGSLARLDAMPADEIAWYNAGRHPAQGVIAISSSTEDSIAGSGENTTAALGVAGENTTEAIALAGNRTGNALQRSLRGVKHAVGVSARDVGKAVGVAPDSNAKGNTPAPAQ